jgi:hypothetical protein
MLRFVERYQRLLAFDFPKQHKVAYARTIDMADYYRRHFKTTPRTVFVSKTDHVQYDMWWLSMWCDGKVLVPRERIPWLTRVSSILSARRQGPYWKDPLSYEYVLIEDQRRSIRFERECPNPIWWFDYTKPDLRPEGSAIAHTETPDVTVIRSPWIRNKGRMTTTLTMKTNAEFPDYVIVLWGLPDDYKPGMQVDTDAKDYVVARSTEGECHLVLFFDLKPDAQLEVAFNL